MAQAERDGTASETDAQRAVRRAAAALEAAGAEVEEIDVFKELAERARAGRPEAGRTFSVRPLGTGRNGSGALWM